MEQISQHRGVERGRQAVKWGEVGRMGEDVWNRLYWGREEGRSRPGRGAEGAGLAAAHCLGLICLPGSM